MLLIIFERRMVYQISCRDFNAVNVGEAERSVKTRKYKIMMR